MRFAALLTLRAITPSSRGMEPPVIPGRFNGAGWSALGLAVVVFFLSLNASAGTITDSGDVLVDTQNQLIVGSAVPGNRLIDGEDDGPYSNVAIGPVSGTYSSVPSTVTIDHYGSLTSLETISIKGPLLSSNSNSSGGAQLSILNGSRVQTNQLLIGGQSRSYGLASLRIESGGSLQSNSAVVKSIGGPSATSISVVGSGSSWINTGLLSASGTGGALISIEDGAHASFGSYWSSAEQSPVILTVTGIGSRLDTGRMDLGSHPRYDYNPDGSTAGISRRTVEILDGGQINSTDVWFSSNTFTPALIQGSGSTWNINGELRLSGGGAGGDSRVAITQGGMVSAQTARIGGGSGFLQALTADGPDSTFNLGQLTLTSQYSSSGLVQMSNGARLLTGATTFSNCLNEYQSSFYCAVRITGSSSWIANGPVDITASTSGYARIDLTDGGQMTVHDQVTIGNRSQLNLDHGGASAERINLEAGTLRGIGLVDGDVVNSGQVSPGDTASGLIGSIEINGAYTQSSSGSLNIQLRGTAPIAGHDVLAVVGTSILGGVLSVGLEDGFVPKFGDLFEVMRYSWHAGEFETYIGLDLGDGITLIPEYGSTSLVLRAVPEPGTALLVGVGLAVIGVTRSRKRD